MTDNQRVRRVNLATGIITTIVGDGSEFFSGDGGPATAAALGFSPRGVAADQEGNIIIGDSNNNRLRQVDAATQVITTIAGTGGFGFSGDGGPAEAAELALPTAVAVAPDGKIYFADTGNNRIRQIDTLGVVNTVAGNGENTFFGEGTSAIEAAFADPFDVTVDPDGNLIIADSSNSRIRKVDLETDIVTTVAGGADPADGLGDGLLATEAALENPYGVAVDAAGNIYIADTTKERVRKVAAIDGVITTLAGIGPPDSDALGDGGPATLATFSATGEIAIDAAGNLYIADTSNSRIRRVDRSTGQITTLAGGRFGSFGDGELAIDAALSDPEGVAVDRDGNVFIAGTGNHRIRRVDAQGIITTVAGNGLDLFSGDDGTATSASLNFPRGVAIDSNGDLLISDTSNNRIRRVDAQGTITTVAGNASAGNSGDGGQATDAELVAPTSVALDASGNIFIVDTGNRSIRRVDKGTGIITRFAGGGELFGNDLPATEVQLGQPRGIALDDAGNAFVTDQTASVVRRIDASGNITTVAGTGEYAASGDNRPGSDAAVASPSGVVLDSAGNLFILDIDRVRAIKGPLP